jgi:uncharacterized Tic20 family protein
MNAAGTPPGFAAPGAHPAQDERTWAMFAHLSAMAGLVVPLVGDIIGPLVIWLVWRHRSAFVAEQAKEALNFNITVTLGWVLCVPLAFVFVGFLLALVLLLYWLTMIILAAIRAGEGHHFHYPLSLRLVR